MELKLIKFELEINTENKLSERNRTGTELKYDFGTEIPLYKLKQYDDDDDDDDIDDDDDYVTMTTMKATMATLMSLTVATKIMTSMTTTMTKTRLWLVRSIWD